jgi:hypothetical protein
MDKGKSRLMLEEKFKQKPREKERGEQAAQRINRNELSFVIFKKKRIKAKNGKKEQE